MHIPSASKRQAALDWNRQWDRLSNRSISGRTRISVSPTMTAERALHYPSIRLSAGSGSKVQPMADWVGHSDS